MRIQLNKIHNWFALVLLLVVISGCKFWAETSGGDKNGNKRKTVAQNKNADSEKSLDMDEKAAKGGLAKNIIGTWKGEDYNLEEKLTMTFKENGLIDIETDFGDEKVSVEATYRIINEQTVEIKYSDGKTRNLTDVKISGDTMQAKGKKGKSITFKRVGAKPNDSGSTSDDDV